MRERLRRLDHLRLVLGAAGAVIGLCAAPIALAQPTSSPIALTRLASATDTSELLASANQTTGRLPLTVAETEGPFYKAGSPETTNLAQDGMPGQIITIAGQVLDQDGQPVANAVLDFWQANPNGVYDNAGYTLRGHQLTDANGAYTLTTVVPGLYPGRTEHIHVKVQAPGGPMLTTQLFFPGVAQNSRDSIYDPSLLLNITDNGDGTLSGSYTFVVATA
jgi:protocatechuate 3,4-dioxygenase beta subunit